MDFDQLTTFLEVAKLGSFSRAGQKVFRSQSAVSTQVRQLEQTCGARLLDRSGKDVTLTPAGEFCSPMRSACFGCGTKRSWRWRTMGRRHAASLSIGANEGTCLYVLPDVFAKYSSLHPGVQINIYRNFTYKIRSRTRSRLARRRNHHSASEVSQPEGVPDFPGPTHVDGQPAESPRETGCGVDRGNRATTAYPS